MQNTNKITLTGQLTMIREINEQSNLADLILTTSLNFPKNVHYQVFHIRFFGENVELIKGKISKNDIVQIEGSLGHITQYKDQPILQVYGDSIVKIEHSTDTAPEVKMTSLVPNDPDTSSTTSTGGKGGSDNPAEKEPNV